MAILIDARMFQKHATEAEWNNSDFIPEDGEIVIYDPDDFVKTSRLKIGDGFTHISSLKFFSGLDGPKGETGNGITSVALNKDYSLTIYYTDGTSYITTSIRGERGPEGPQGPQGPQGASIVILGSYASEEELKLTHPVGKAGDGYLVKGDLYIWDATVSSWKNVGVI